MDYPFGHHNHRHHQRDGRGDNEQEEEYPPPAPPSFYPPPPPRQSYYQGDRPPPPPYYAPPRPPPEGFNYSAFPQQGEGDSSLSYSSSSVQHVSHDPVSPQGSIESETHQHHHLTSFLHHHTHQASELTNKPPVRVFCKAETGYSLTIRDGKVILAPSHHADDFQHWIKDEKYSTKVKDQEGFPSFALINKATGQAMKHSVGATHPVQLVPYNPDVLDESVLWTESKDLGDGFRTIRMVNNIRLNVDAFHGDKNHGGVCDGTTIVLWEWKKGDNQRWKIIPY